MKNIKFKIQLAEDQKLAVSKMLNSKIVLITGKAGTGKTACIAKAALKLLFNKESTGIERIVIVRPTVIDKESENLGALPGELDSKLMPFISAVVDNMYKIYNPEKIDALIKDGKIVYKTIQHIKGSTVTNEILIVDEVEDATSSQILKMLTRLGKHAKIFFNGDLAQCDLKNNNSGITKLIDVCNSLEEMEHIELTTNHRDPIIEEIIKKFSL